MKIAIPHSQSLKKPRNAKAYRYSSGEMHCQGAHIKNHGSSFDEFVNMGAYMPLGNDEIDYLKKVSIPKMTVSETAVIDKTLMIEAVLKPLEVRLIEVSMI
jgi:beta-xylosidase